MLPIIFMHHMWQTKNVLSHTCMHTQTSTDSVRWPLEPYPQQCMMTLTTFAVIKIQYHSKWVQFSLQTETGSNLIVITVAAFVCFHCYQSHITCFPNLSLILMTTTTGPDAMYMDSLTVLQCYWEWGFLSWLSLFNIHDASFTFRLPYKVASIARVSLCHV